MRRLYRQIYDYVPLKIPVFKALRKLNLPEPIYRHLHFKGEFEVSVNSFAFKMKHYGFQLENELFWSHRWERTSLILWSEAASHSRYIFDVGANTGCYSLLAKAANDKSEVHAFEPVNRVYLKLLENIRLNGYEIMANELAISDYKGVATIYDLPDDHIYSVTINTNRHIRGDAFPVRVNVTTIEEYMATRNVPKIDLIKLDIESHEPEVLSQSKEAIKAHHPTMLIEILSEEAANKIFNFLIPLGYFGFEVIESERIIRRTSGWGSGFGNYFFCSPKKLDPLLKVVEVIDDIAV